MPNYSLIEFLPNQSLLKHDFEGYKLSCDDCPVYSKHLEYGLQDSKCEEASCYLYTRILSLHNHLFSDPFNASFVYTFNTKGCLSSFNYSEDLNLEGPFIVWQDESGQISSADSASKLFLPPSISFPSTDLAIAINGQNRLNILQTGNRREGRSWLNIFEEEVSPGVLWHSALTQDEDTSSQHQKELDVVVVSVSPTEELKSDSSVKFDDNSSLTSTSFLHVVHWLTYSYNGKKWERYRERKLIGSGGLEFLSLMPSCKEVLLLSHDKYQFAHDSLHPIEVNAKSATVSEEKQAPLFGFMQDSDSITMWLNVGPKTQKKDVNVLVSVNKLKILVNENPVLEQSFLHPTKSSESAWTLDEGKLEIMIPKTLAGGEETARWSSLFEGGNQGGEEVPNPEVVEEVQQRLAHLTSEDWNANPEKDKPAFNPGQLEECDNASENLLVSVISGESHECTHMARLGAVQHLFNTLPEGSTYPDFCLRHDVDGILWELRDSVVPHHVSTFHAFGYVKASKTMAKYTKAAPDLSYVAVADVNSHIYIFYQSDKFGGELRNRKTGRSSTTIARQLIITLKNHDEIMGFHCMNNAIFVLTKAEIFLYLLKRNS